MHKFKNTLKKILHSGLHNIFVFFDSISVDCLSCHSLGGNVCGQTHLAQPITQGLNRDSSITWWAQKTWDTCCKNKHLGKTCSPSKIL